MSWPWTLNIYERFHNFQEENVDGGIIKAHHCLVYTLWEDVVNRAF